MFKHLLIPLDGSRLAESALGPAAYLVETLGASATLLHVIERNAPEKIHGDRHLTTIEEAHAYLAQVVKRHFPGGAPVDRHVHTAEVSDVPASIETHARELGADLIVMCTHGSGGLHTWLFGSIAQQVIALGTTPVLLVHPTSEDATPKFACHRLLLPLDGNGEHEHALPVSAGLARKIQADVHLLMVVRTRETLAREQWATAKLLPGAASVMLDLFQQSAEIYMESQVEALQDQGITVHGEVRRGEPSSSIVGAAQHVKADLIVMGTHGKTHMDAFWSGSVAPRVSSHSRVPLLLVPVGESAP